MEHTDYVDPVAVIRFSTSWKNVEDIILSLERPQSKIDQRPRLLAEKLIIAEDEDVKRFIGLLMHSLEILSQDNEVLADTWSDIIRATRLLCG